MFHLEQENMESFTYHSAIDEWPIHAYIWRPPDSPKATVVIAHGLAEHALRYDRFARALTDKAFEVRAMDHRGHGVTMGPRGLGDFGEGGWDALVADMDQMIELTQEQHPGLPIVLLGHSMGAAAAQQFTTLGSDKIDALVLSGSTLSIPGEARTPPNAAFEPARTPYDWLSRDESEVDKYIDDPLCGFEAQTLRNGFDRDDTRRLDPVRLARIRDDLPVLLVAGDADPVNNNLEGLMFLEEMWRNAGVKQIDKLIYPGGRHEMLNETNSDEVTDDIVNWLGNVLDNPSQS